MKTVLAIAASVLVSAFVAVFHPNEYVWMREDFGVGQIPEDPDMLFKLNAVLIVHALVQIAAFVFLLRSGRKAVAFGLAVLAGIAALLLLQRV
jgi:hypothetical protein